MKRFLWILGGLALAAVGALAYLAVHFFEEATYQKNAMKTFTARETRRLRKQEGNDEPDDTEDHLDKVVNELKTEVLNQNSQNSNEETN